jgi:cyclase
MLRKRIIFTLIYSDGNFMQSRNFRLQKVGDLQWLERNYKFQHIAFSLDELIVLNASKGEKKIFDFASTISKLVNDVFIPISAGGGIRSLEDADLLFKSGADKIVLNTLLIENPDVVKKIIQNYGSQSVVACIDCKLRDNIYDVFIKDGSIKIEYELNEYVVYLERLGVGEIYLNSIDNDGTGFGFDQNLINTVNNISSLPLIIAGGAGNESHLVHGLNIENVSAVATANLFNFIGDGLPKARRKVSESSINIANWDGIDRNI